MLNIVTMEEPLTLCQVHRILDRVIPSQMPCTGTEIALCCYRSIRKCAPIFDEYAVDRAYYQR